MMLVGAMSLSASAALVYNAPFAVAPTIDGVVSAGEWDDAEPAEMAVMTNPGKQLAQNPTMKIMHDGAYMYVLIEAVTPDAKNNVFLCVHVPHEGCKLDGCKSYIKFVVDNSSVAKGDDNPVWTYQKDANFDGKTDFEDPQGGRSNVVDSVAYGFVNGKFTAEIKIAANYGNPIPSGECYVDVRIDNDSCWATHQWAYQLRTWDPTFNPAYDAGVVYFLAEGEEAPTITETEPVETEPIETEPVETEPVETEPVETEPLKTEPVETEPVETDPVETEEVTDDIGDSTADEGGFPTVAVVAVAAVFVLAVVLFFVFKKRK